MGITPRGGDDGSQNSAYHSCFSKKTCTFNTKCLFILKYFLYPTMYRAKHVQSNFHVRKNN